MRISDVSSVVCSSDLVDGVDRVVLRGDGVATHATRHAHALEDTAGGGAGADGTGLAVVAVRTVRGAHTVEAVALHDTGVALALAGARDVALVAGREHVGGRAEARRVGNECVSTCRSPGSAEP